jgi:hypothetical protein
MPTKMILLVLALSANVWGSDKFLLSLDSGQTYTVAEVANDSKNKIPLMRESMCFYGQYYSAWERLKDWGERQFADIRTLPEPPQRQIELAHYYVQCLEEDMTADGQWGEPKPCLRYSDPIYTQSKFVQSCQ